MLRSASSIVTKSVHFRCISTTTAKRSELDLLIKNAAVVFSDKKDTPVLDLGIKNGKVVEISSSSSSDAKEEFDANGLMAFPGAVDAHTHIAGIYQDIELDMFQESKCAAQGGVTTVMPYIRSGLCYLNEGGSYKDLYLKFLSHAKNNYHCDYAYHVSPIEGKHIQEMEWLIKSQGVPSLGEVFMFYGQHSLHGASTKEKQNDFLQLQTDEKYDLGYYDFMLRELGEIADRNPELKEYIQVGFHCETPELLSAWTKKIQEEGGTGHKAWSDARPTHSEGLAIWTASYLSAKANVPNVNILHITCKDAMEAVLQCQKAFPNVNFGREMTAGHLLLDYNMNDGPCWMKVNPPIRSRDDVEYLWKAVANKDIDWIVTDHASAPTDFKVNSDDPSNIWDAKAGFGGVEYLLAGLYSEGVVNRGVLAPNDVARLVSKNPAQRFGMGSRKGEIALGYDADIALFDPKKKWTIDPKESFSTQTYTPFEGINVTGKVQTTFLRGNRVFDDGEIIGKPHGEYLARPLV
jgi:allantoinase